jgi:integrase
MDQLITAVGQVGRTRGPRLKALFGCMYYGMLRPSEAASLLIDECQLPETGWGRLEFSEISSAAGRDWTDDGAVHQASKPKGGPRNAVRRVPIPPVLVTMLRDHVDQYGTAPHGRLFQTPRAAASTCRPPSGPCSERRTRSLSPKRSRPRRWPAGPTTAVTRASPGG